MGAGGQGQRVTYWRKEPLEIDAVIEGSRDPTNYSEANFASSFSVPNTKSLFSFITLRKKWFTRLTGMSNVCVRRR